MPEHPATDRQQFVQALQNSDDRFRRIVEMAQEGIWENDADQRTTFANARLAAMLATTVDEMIGVPIYAFMDPEWQAIAAAAMDRHRDGADEHLEFKFRRKDGGELWAIVSANPRFDADGHYVGALAMITDITERKRAEVALARRESQLAEAQRLAQLGSWEWDLVAGRSSWSDETYRIFNADPAAGPMSFEAFLTHVHPDDAPRIRGLAEAAIQAGKPFQYEARILDADGGVRFFQSRGTLEHDADGRPIRITGTAQDITEQRRSHDDLQESERRLRALVGSLDDIVFEFDEHGTYVNIWANDESLLARPRDDLLGRRVVDVLGDEVGGPYAEAFKRVLRTGVSERIEYSMDVGAGTCWFLASINPVQWPDGHYRTVSMLSRDITEQKRAMDAIIEAGQAAEEMNRAKDDLLRNVSHEVRTPMNGVIGMAELLLDTPLTTEQRLFATTIQQSGAALLNIINDMLDFSQIEAGALVLNEQACDPGKIAAEVVQRLIGQGHVKGIDLMLRVDPEVPTAAHVDPVRLRQLLLILAGNAVKFTHQGRVVLHVGVAPDPSPPQHDGPGQPRPAALVFEIADTGIGISLEAQRRLFAPFSQADGSTTRKYGGTGLGLAIARRLTELMGGSIELDSVPGHGTTCWLTLPTVPSAERSERAARSGTGRLSAGAASLERSESPLVLVADSSLINQKVTTQMLKRLSYRVEAVADGPAAVEAAASTQYAAILLDSALPGQDGFEAAAQIRAREAGPSRVPIIALDADALNRCEQRYLAAGIDAWIPKPFTLAQLREVLTSSVGSPARSA